MQRFKKRTGVVKVETGCKSFVIKRALLGQSDNTTFLNFTYMRF